MLRNRFIKALLGSAIAVAIVAAPAAAADQTVTVKNNGDGGWSFNPDPANATPYNFTTDEASTGFGSLYVQPISTTDGPRKFIAVLPLGIDASTLDSISYDFQIAGNGTALSANQFYLNVYTNLPSSTTYYDCRYDYVPATGSTTEFTTFTADSSGPAIVRPRGAVTCPATLDGLPTGSTVSFITLNVGDTTVVDGGLGGYYDNVVVTTDGGSTAYDFEASPATKDDCKKGGYAAYGFKNQGECVSSLVSNKG